MPASCPALAPMRLAPGQTPQKCHGASAFSARPPRRAARTFASPRTQEGGTARGAGTAASANVSQSIRLSIGQKQLLCFCRALLRDSPILCLDEANSAMDSSVEEEVLAPIIKWCLRFVRTNFTQSAINVDPFFEALWSVFSEYDSAKFSACT